jgi:hypothetical protein
MQRTGDGGRIRSHLVKTDGPGESGGGLIRGESEAWWIPAFAGMTRRGSPTRDCDPVTVK